MGSLVATSMSCGRFSTCEEGGVMELLLLFLRFVAYMIDRIGIWLGLCLLIVLVGCAGRTGGLFGSSLPLEQEQECLCVERSYCVDTPPVTLLVCSCSQKGW